MRPIACAAFHSRGIKRTSRTSLGGPGQAYAWLAAKQLDGTPLLNGSASIVNISRTWVSAESSTGVVDVYYASPSGAATAEDVLAANGTSGASTPSSAVFAALTPFTLGLAGTSFCVAVHARTRRIVPERLAAYEELVEAVVR